MPITPNSDALPIGVIVAWFAVGISQFVAVWVMRKWRPSWVDPVLIGSVVVIEVLLVWIAVRTFIGRNDDSFQAWLPSLTFLVVGAAFWVWHRGWGLALAAVLILVAMPVWFVWPWALAGYLSLEVLVVGTCLAVATLIGAELSWPGRRSGKRSDDYRWA